MYDRTWGNFETLSSCTSSNFLHLQQAWNAKLFSAKHPNFGHQKLSCHFHAMVKQYGLIFACSYMYRGALHLPAFLPVLYSFYKSLAGHWACVQWVCPEYTLHSAVAAS